MTETETEHGPMPPRSMEQHERLRVRAAIVGVRRMGLPPGIAEMVGRELEVWQEFGYRLGGGSLVRRVVDEIMTPAPAPVAAEDRRSVAGKSAVGYGG
jgi:hypothetical protein